MCRFVEEVARGGGEARCGTDLPRDHAAEGSDGVSLRRRVVGVDLAIGTVVHAPATHTALVETGRLRCAPSENGFGVINLRQLAQPERRKRREGGTKHGGDAEGDEGAEARGVLPYLPWLKMRFSGRFVPWSHPSRAQPGDGALPLISQTCIASSALAGAACCATTDLSEATSAAWSLVLCVASACSAAFLAACFAACFAASTAACFISIAAASAAALLVPLGNSGSVPNLSCQAKICWSCRRAQNP